MGMTRVSASEVGSEVAGSGESNPTFSVGNSQRRAGKFTESRLGLSLLKNIARDQKSIWKSLTHLRLNGANGLIPFAGITAAPLAVDTHTPRS